MLLREVVGDEKSETSNMETVRLDGNEVSRQTLEEKKQDQSIRIAEVSDNEFKTLKHLKG